MSKYPIRGISLFIFFFSGCLGQGYSDFNKYRDTVSEADLPYDSTEDAMENEEDVDDLPLPDGEYLPPLSDRCSGAGGNIQDSYCLEDDDGVLQCYYIMYKECSKHSDCNDHIFCNTEERCGRVPWGGNYCYLRCCPPCNPCNDPPADNPECYSGVCVEALQSCIYTVKDEDMDGYADEACGGDDCDDLDNSRYPGREDICDGSDNNCNAVVDEDGWKISGDAAEGTPIYDGGASTSLHTLVPVGEKWRAAWLENDSIVKCVEIDGSEAARPVEIYGPPADGRVIGSLSIAGPAGSTAVLWSEVSGEGSAILFKRIPDGAGVQPGVLFSTVGNSGEVIGDVVVKNGSDSGTEAGVFFKMGAGDGSGNFEIFYLPVEDITAIPALPAAETEPKRITDFIGFSGHPDAAALPGGEWMVAWDDTRDGNREIYVRKIDFQASPPLEPEIRITSSPGDSQEPSIACLAGTGQCAVAWMDERLGPYAIFTTILGDDGRIEAPETALTVPPESAWNQSIIPDGEREQFIVSFSASRQPASHTLYFTFVNGEMEHAVAASPVKENIVNPTSPLTAMNNRGALGFLWQEFDREGYSSIYFMPLSCSL